MKRTAFRTTFLLAVLSAFGAAAAAAAQESPDTISVLDGVYTEEQAAEGQRTFDTECGLCHTPGEFSGPVFHASWGGRPLGALFVHVSQTMPLDRPGALDAAEYASVVSYVLELNGYPAGEKALPANADSLVLIRLDPPPDDGR